MKWQEILLIIITIGVIFNMVLDFPGLLNTTFKYSKETEQGFGSTKNELIWSISGISFKGWIQGNQGLSFPGLEHQYHYTIGTLESDQDTAFFFAPVELPDGAVITSAIVFGNLNTNQWVFDQIELITGTETEIAAANFNSNNDALTDFTIDNSKFAYLIRTGDLDDTDTIYGAKITYTL